MNLAYSITHGLRSIDEERVEKDGNGILKDIDSTVESQCVLPRIDAAWPEALELADA